MKATFENTVNILVKAYLNDTLKHGDCSACAVGNILGGSEWKSFFVTWLPSLKQEFNPQTYGVTQLEKREIRIKGARLIEKSGYTKMELARIENAFETAPKNCSELDGKNEEWMFNGLMAVVDVLAEIHNVDLTQRESAKLLFVK